LLTEEKQIFIYPARHYVTDENNLIRRATISEELEQRGQDCACSETAGSRSGNGRTKYDMEMLLETGMCAGIENYSRICNAPRGQNQQLVDYFPKDYLLIIDESHVTIPQINAMHSRIGTGKNVGRSWISALPSALDNRPCGLRNSWGCGIRCCLYRQRPEV